MDYWIKFATDHWAVIGPVVLLAVSEFLSLHPGVKSNGIVELAVNLLSRK